MRNIMDDYRDLNSETGYTTEYDAFYEAVMEAGATDFDCKQVASALARGLTPQAAAAEFNKDRDEDREDGRLMGREFNLDFDYSMNG